MADNSTQRLPESQEQEIVIDAQGNTYVGDKKVKMKPQTYGA
jgi:hypothetical protein